MNGDNSYLDDPIFSAGDLFCHVVACYSCADREPYEWLSTEDVIIHRVVRQLGGPDVKMYPTSSLYGHFRVFEKSFLESEYEEDYIPLLEKDGGFSDRVRVIYEVDLDLVVGKPTTVWKKSDEYFVKLWGEHAWIFNKLTLVETIHCLPQSSHPEEIAHSLSETAKHYLGEIEDKQPQAHHCFSQLIESMNETQCKILNEKEKAWHEKEKTWQEKLEKLQNENQQLRQKATREQERGDKAVEFLDKTRKDLSRVTKKLDKKESDLQTVKEDYDNLRKWVDNIFKNGRPRGRDE